MSYMGLHVHHMVPLDPPGPVEAEQVKPRISTKGRCPSRPVAVAGCAYVGKNRLGFRV